MGNNEKTTMPPRRGPMVGPRGRGVPGEKPKNFKNAVKRLILELDKFRVLILVSLILAVIGAILSILAPDRLSDLTDEIQKGLFVSQSMDMDAIKNITVLLIGMYLCSALFNYIQSITMTIISNKFAKELRNRISVKINKLPLKYFDKHQSGDILSRVTTDVDTIAQSMNQSLGSLVINITLFLGSIIMMFITNWIMAFTAIGASLLGFMGMFFILAKSQKYFIVRQK